MRDRRFKDICLTYVLVANSQIRKRLASKITAWLLTADHYREIETRFSF